ncbi:molybdopterin-binding protein [Bacillus sp. N9]
MNVATRPVIGVIATGSELLRPEDELVPGKIRNSNGFMIESQILRAGAVYKRYGSCADNIDSLYQAIKKHSSNAILLLQQEVYLSGILTISQKSIVGLGQIYYLIR